ncbi:MAG: sulfur carrier protein ThiS [Bacteroidales bacterium]|nr:sulfur carrier protein ThiS [Bacteroidales bacterium]
MKIILNNREEEVTGNEMTLQQLLDSRNYSFKLLVTKINGKLIRKEDRSTAMIGEGDRVMVLHLISGG